MRFREKTHKTPKTVIGKEFYEKDLPGKLGGRAPHWRGRRGEKRDSTKGDTEECPQWKEGSEVKI